MPGCLCLLQLLITISMSDINIIINLLPDAIAEADVVFKLYVSMSVFVLVWTAIYVVASVLACVYPSIHPPSSFQIKVFRK